MRSIITTIILVTFQMIVMGQLKVESVYPFDYYYRGNVSLLLYNENNDPNTGNTSFQIISNNGDTITHKSASSYYLPNKNSYLTYTLELRDEYKNLPNNFSGTLVLTNPSLEIDFELNNYMNSEVGEDNECEDFEIVSLHHTGDFSRNELSILVTSNRIEGAGISGYTSLQLINSMGDTLSANSGPHYFLPIFPTDTVVYNLELLPQYIADSIDVGSDCFKLRTFWPDCLLDQCGNSGAIETQLDYWNIYPNPFENTVEFEGKAFSRVEIYDMNGKLVGQHFDQEELFNGHKLKSGMYLFKIYNKEKVFLKKMAKL